MAINYNDPNYGLFSINWDMLFSRLETIKIFRNRKVNQLFCNTWKKILIDHETDSTKTFSVAYFSQVEHYPLPLFFEGSTIGNVAIDIDACEKEIYRQQLQPFQIKQENFLEQQVFFLQDYPAYTSTHVITYNQPQSKAKFSYIPVLIFDSLFTNHATVIDGNHRVSSLLTALENDTIPSYILNTDFFNSRKFFLDDYSYYLFSFWKELHFFYFNNRNRSIFARLHTPEKKYLNTYSTFVNYI